MEGKCLAGSFDTLYFCLGWKPFRVPGQAYSQRFAHSFLNCKGCLLYNYCNAAMAGFGIGSKFIIWTIQVF